MNHPQRATSQVADLLPRPNSEPVKIATLNQWRLSILNEVAAYLSSPEMPALQKKVAVWKYNDSIPYPQSAEIQCLENGCMNFTVEVGQHEVFYSLWMTPGEVRFGVKVPNALIAGEPLRERLSRSYDGQPCPRMERIGGHTFFDWIWKNEEFAEFGFMVRSVRDGMLASVIADRLSSLAIHIYLATVHALIEGNSMKVAFRRIAQTDLEALLIEWTGDEEALTEFLDRRGWKIDHRQVNGNKEVTTVVGPKPMNLITGPIQNQDGARCIIISVKPFQLDAR